jgi:hypothetical protein
VSSLNAADIGPRLLTTRFTRPRAFPNDDRRLMDMRRSGVVEAVAGDAGPIGLAAKLANSIGRSNTLHKPMRPSILKRYAAPTMRDWKVDGAPIPMARASAD